MVFLGGAVLADIMKSQEQFWCVFLSSFRLFQATYPIPRI